MGAAEIVDRVDLVREGEVVAAPVLRRQLPGGTGRDEEVALPGIAEGDQRMVQPPQAVGIF